MLLNKNYRKSIITSMKGILGSSALLKNKNKERKMTIVEIDATPLYFKSSEGKSGRIFLATLSVAQAPKTMSKNSGGIYRCYQTFYDDCKQPRI